MTYRTKQEAYNMGHNDGYFAGLQAGIPKERARQKKKDIVNPLYNRPTSLKERVDREAEVDQELPEWKPIAIPRTKKQPFSVIKWIKSYLP